MDIRTPPFAAGPMRRLLPALVASCFALSPFYTLAAPPATPLVQNDEAKWLVMIYSDADDNVLEQDMLIDMQEAELIGSTDEVVIVTQTDRYDGSFDGMGDWTSTKRFLITQDSDMDVFGSEELEDLGEVNMSDGQTLLEFIEWAVTTYPAEKRMLILSDHGSGWPGGWSDPDPGGTGDHDIVLAEAFGDNLWLMEIDEVLGQARANLGIEAFDVIGFDACLMSQLEVYNAIAPHALYSVASEEVEPGLGWAYAGFLGQLVANPDMGGDELVVHVVDSYIEEDMRLEDPEYVGDASPEQAAAEISPDVTLTAVDLAQIEPLNAALDNFAAALSTINPDIVATARTYAQSYESVFGDDMPSPYIDLGHFSQLIQSNTDDPAVLAAAQELDAAREAAVLAEMHGPARPGSTGIAIYFPVREMYELAGNLGYAEVAKRFVDATQWDEFIGFHNGDTQGATFARPASPTATVLQSTIPDIDAELVAVLEDEIAAQVEDGAAPEEIAQFLVDEYQLPEEAVVALADAGLLGGEAIAEAPAAAVVSTSAAKPLQLAPVRLSAEVAYPGEPVTIETDVDGDRVGYIYRFIGRILPEDDILLIEDEDFLFADTDAEVGGVTYPQWPEGDFTVSYDWEPIVYAISDGETSIRTLFSPETYGESPTYAVEGIYTFVDGSPDRYARLYFSDGELSEVFGFAGSGTSGTGAPSEITPQPGDQFTVLEQGFNLAADVENGEDDSYSGEVGTLTFGDEPFFIEETPAPSGNYVVGIIAEDLDGRTVETYEGLFVVGEEEVTEEGFVPLVSEDLGFALLHPATWAPTEASDESAGRVVIATEDGSAQMTVSVFENPDASNATEADLAAVESILGEFAASDGIENFETVGEPADFVLGAYDARMVDFQFESDGVTYTGEVVAATPTPGLTYVVDFVAPAEDAEALLPDLDAVLYSFDILLSGIERAEAGAPQPDFAETLFVDDYGDPASGLYDDAEAQEWGQGYYDAESEQYVYAMNAQSGPIYDYYADGVLPDPFLLQVTAQTAGAVDTAFGLIFQVLDDDHFYTFRVSGDGYYLVEKANGDTLETLVDWTPADPFDTEEEALNTLAVAGSGGEYALYVNGVQVGAFADEEYSKGAAGYMVENFDETGAAFVFDDFVVGVPAE